MAVFKLDCGKVWCPAIECPDSEDRCRQAEQVVERPEAKGEAERQEIGPRRNQETHLGLETRC